MDATHPSAKPQSRIVIPIEQIQLLPVRHRVTIPADYIDRLGHMNVIYYFQTFGQGAMRNLQASGITEDYIDNRRNGCFVLTQIIRYIAEVREGDTVAVHARMIARSEKKLLHMYFMVNETQHKLAATLEALNIHADLNTRGSSPFPADIAANIDALIADQSTLGWDAPVSRVLTV